MKVVITPSQLISNLGQTRRNSSALCLTERNGYKIITNEYMQE